MLFDEMPIIVSEWLNKDNFASGNSAPDFFNAVMNLFVSAFNAVTTVPIFSGFLVIGICAIAWAIAKYAQHSVGVQ